MSSTHSTVADGIEKDHLAHWLKPTLHRQDLRYAATQYDFFNSDQWNNSYCEDKTAIDKPALPDSARRYSDGTAIILR